MTDISVNDGGHSHSATTIALDYTAFDRVTDVLTLATGSVMSVPTAVSGDFSVVATFLNRPETGAVGLYIANATDGVFYGIGEISAVITPATFVEDPPGSGLYAPSTSSITEGPPGLYTVTPPLVEDPVGSDLYRV